MHYGGCSFFLCQECHRNRFCLIINIIACKVNAKYHATVSSPSSGRWVGIQRETIRIAGVATEDAYKINTFPHM
jgi:hypothetical protein